MTLIGKSHPVGAIKEMEKYFDIKYEFSLAEVHDAIARQLKIQEPGYICVADGVVLSVAHRNKDYMEVQRDSMFALCDSNWVPLYIKWIWGRNRNQCCGAMIFEEVVKQGRYRQAFLGTNQKTLDALKTSIEKWGVNTDRMMFVELPYCKVDDFDYPEIAKRLDDFDADVIWVALGAPKQEFFMHNLKPHLKHGVQLGVGAAFNFHAGMNEKRAPKWMIKNRMEFVYRIMQDPKKQLRRCGLIVTTLPKILWEEMRRKRRGVHL